MNPPTVGRTIFGRGGKSAALFLGAVIFVSACGGADSSDAAASEDASDDAASGGAGALVSPPTSAIAPLGTGFVMVSARSQLRLEEPTYREHADCMLQVSSLQDAEEFAGCMEVPRTAICLQVTLGYTEADRSWECFVEPVVCEDRTSEHDMLWQLVKDARAILQPCAERELTSVFGA